MGPGAHDKVVKDVNQRNHVEMLEQFYGGEKSNIRIRVGVRGLGLV